MKKTIIAAALLLTTGPAGSVVVSWQPSTTTAVQGETFAVDIVADLPNPVLGWGLDINFDRSVLGVAGTEVGPAWDAVFSPDGDGLAGLAFPAVPAGEGTLLATVSFDAVGEGTSDMQLGVTPGDLTEGFLVEGSPGLADADFESGSVTVQEAASPVSAPATVLLLVHGIVLMGLGWRRGRRQSCERCRVRKHGS